MEETDIHWVARKGIGNFNYRIKFDIDLPATDPARIAIKCWDKDALTFSSDLIGFQEFNANKILFKEGLDNWHQHLDRMKILDELTETEIDHELSKIMIKDENGKEVVLNVPADAKGNRDKKLALIRHVVTSHARLSTVDGPT